MQQLYEEGKMKKNIIIRQIKLNIDIEKLDEQIKEVLESNISEVIKTGIHNLLGEIKDHFLSEEVVYPINGVTKEDILGSFDGHPEEDQIIECVNSLNDNDMEWLASKMSDNYCDNGFWTDLESIFKDRIYSDWKKRQEVKDYKATVHEADEELQKQTPNKVINFFVSYKEGENHMIKTFGREEDAEKFADEKNNKLE